MIPIKRFKMLNFLLWRIKAGGNIYIKTSSYVIITIFEPTAGIEPATYSLRMSCSTS